MNKDNDISNTISIDDLKADLNHHINSFPIEVYPRIIQDFIIDAEKTLNFNRDFFAASILSAISLAIGNSYRVNIKETWTTKCNLFIAIVGDSGDGKSHPLKEAFQPIDDKENEYYENYKEERARYLDNPQGLKEPIGKRLLLRDFTLEALTRVHSQNPKGIGILADELLGWLKNLGRFNSGSDMESYLEIWNGRKITSDRVGNVSIIKDAFVNIIGGIQRDKLYEILKKDFEANGFVYRILWVDPGPQNFIPENDSELNPIHKKNYQVIINKLLEQRENDVNYTIQLTPEAKHERRKWWNEFGERNFYEESYIKGTSTKIKEYFNRFLVIFTALDCAVSEVSSHSELQKSNLFVNTKSVNKAKTLAEYFFKNAIDVRNYKSDPLEKMGKAKKAWYLSLPTSKLKTAEIKAAGTSFDIATRTVEKWINNEEHFLKIGHGIYKRKL